MGNALSGFEGFDGALCCASDAANAPPSAGSARAPRQSLEGIAQQVKHQLLDAQQVLHPSKARVSALFDLYDMDCDGALDPAELKNVMLDVYKGAIATLTERSIVAAEQATAAAAAVAQVDRRWEVSSDPLGVPSARRGVLLSVWRCRRQEGERSRWTADAPERAVLLEERAATTHRQRLSDWNEESIKHCLAELNRHYVYIRSDPRPEAVLELIPVLDRDHDGRIDKQEFVDGFSQHMKDSFATLDAAEIDRELARQQESVLEPSAGAVAAAAGDLSTGGSAAGSETSIGEQALRSLLAEEEWI